MRSFYVGKSINFYLKKKQKPGVGKLTQCEKVVSNFYRLKTVDIDSKTGALK